MAKRTATAEQETEREFVKTELWESFARRHGEYLEIGDGQEGRVGVFNSRIIFEDGATAVSRHPINHGGQDPPLHIVDNGHARRVFAAEKLAREIKAHDEFLSNCKEQANFHLRNPENCPPPPANWKEQLAAGEKRIEQWQNRVQELDDILSKLDEAIANRRARSEAAEEKYRKREALFEELLTYGGHAPINMNNGITGADSL
jgi:hypothetical protein